MKWLTGWFLDNPIAANLLMCLLLAAGVLSLGTLRVESFPQLPPSQLVVTVAYPGGTARQVDESITQRVEEAISSVAGIRRISSESVAGYSTVRIRKTADTDLDRLLDDVRNEVNSIPSLPAQAEIPRVTRDEFNNLALFVIVAGDVDDSVLQQSATRVERELKQHSDISRVSNTGKRRPLLQIEPDPEQLQRYGLSVEELGQRIQGWSLEYRSGSLKTPQGDMVLRADGYADSLGQLNTLPVINTTEGTIQLSEVARVRRDFEQDDAIVRFQGKPAVALMISTSQKDNLFRVREAVDDVLADMQPQLPADIQLDVMADMTPGIKEQLTLLSTNAWQGLLIVLVVLGMFLEVRLAFWVALGIPISLAGTLALMPEVGYSINDITLFGMILVLGILVDDAVVVGESIHEARGHIADPKQAARSGVESVAVATTYGALTTIAAFSPMLWIQNDIARVLASFSAVVIIALLFSLVESKFILPSHLCLPRGKRVNSLPGRWLGIVRHRCTGALDRFAVRVYQPVLAFSLHHRASVVLIFSTLMILAYGMVFRGEIRSAFFPDIPSRYLQVNVIMDQDAPLSLTQKNASLLEDKLDEVQRGIQDTYSLSEEPVTLTLVSVPGDGTIELTAELSTEALEKIPGWTLLTEWEQATGRLEGSYSTRFSAAEALGGGTAIIVSAPDRELARQVAGVLKEKLAVLPGVKDVSDDSQGGQRQAQITVNKRGRMLGITQSQLATLIGGAYGDLEVYRLLEGGEETRVNVRFRDTQRTTMDNLMVTPVRVENGDFVSLGDIAEIRFKREPEILYRRDRQGIVTVYWRQNRSIASPEEIWSSLEKEVAELERAWPGARIKAVGEFEDIGEVRSGFKKALLLTLLLIYILMAIPLKSYWQPVIIMSVIPFGFAGAIFGHGLMNLPVSILSLFGMMAMTGVVVNDSLVLMTRFNDLHRQGVPLREALITAGRSRMRAIFLTTVTTVCGLLPLLSETSEQAQYLKPAAVALVFGELFATPITLILIPLLLSFQRQKKAAVEGE